MSAIDPTIDVAGPALIQYRLWMPLASAASAGAPLGPRKANFRPGRDVAWNVIRVWAYSVGYEPQPNAGSQGFTDEDPYSPVQGGQQLVPDGYCLNFWPVAMFYKNTISLDMLIFPFRFVPRTFEPVALQQATRIGKNESVQVLGSEHLSPNWSLASSRTQRGIAFGIEVEEFPA